MPPRIEAQQVQMQTARFHIVGQQVQIETCRRLHIVRQQVQIETCRRLHIVRQQVQIETRRLHIILLQEGDTYVAATLGLISVAAEQEAEQRASSADYTLKPLLTFRSRLAKPSFQSPKKTPPISPRSGALR